MRKIQEGKAIELSKNIFRNWIDNLKPFNKLRLKCQSYSNQNKLTFGYKPIKVLPNVSG